ncbi:hypothetical protein BFL36_10420 [Clavibacter michiganensis]|uniref:Uncharacterized protein n=2 Tax=Clavibacter michiganensis TaxID=28447 RepID=A0A251YDM5_9MICO|nr:hypothetical protein BFL36_10420 [Clavibacter michiganensis]
MIIATLSEYRAYTSKDVDKIGTEVSSVLKKFVSGSEDAIISGMGDLVTTALTVLLGSGSAEEGSMTSYYITAEDYALVRYDICAWQRRIEATGITTLMENSLAVYASKAAIKVSELDLNVFLLAYSNQLRQMNIPREEYKQYLDTATEIYERLKGATPTTESQHDGAHLRQQITSARPTVPGVTVFS